MASENATALAVRKEEAVEVVDAKPCPDMLALQADAKAAEELVPWTYEEAEKAPLAELGDRVRLVCSHFKHALISEHDFVMKYRNEFRALRERSRQQGRRLPIPGCPDWTEVKKAYFKTSSRQIDRLLEDPDKPKAERKRKPKKTPVAPPAAPQATVEDTSVAGGDETADEVAKEVEEKKEEAAANSEYAAVPGEKISPSVFKTFFDACFSDGQGGINWEKLEEFLRLLDRSVRCQLVATLEEIADQEMRAEHKAEREAREAEAAAKEKAKPVVFRGEKGKALREEIKNEILRVLAQHPDNLFTLAGVRQRLGRAGLSDSQLHNLLSEGVREERWESERCHYAMGAQHGWGVQGAFKRWKGEPHRSGCFLCVGSDEEVAAWKAKEEKDQQEWDEWMSRHREEHPEQYPRQGESYDEFKKRRDHELRSEAAKLAAVTRQRNRANLSEVKTVVLNGAKTWKEVQKETGFPKDEVDDLLYKLQQQKDAAEMDDKPYELSFVPEPSWMESIGEREDEEEDESGRDDQE